MLSAASQASVRTDWNEAISAYRAAFEGWTAAFRFGASQAILTDRIGRVRKLEEATLCTPAPDLAGVIDKLLLMWRDVDDAEGSDTPGQRSVISDLRRLALAETMPATAELAWEAYTEAVTALRDAEQINAAPRERVARGLDVCRAWNRCLAAMGTTVPPPTAPPSLMILDGGRTT